MLLKMSVYGGALILFTMIIRFFFVNKLPKRGFICLWILAILRLLIPFDLPITSNFVATNPVISNTSASLDNINTYITSNTSQRTAVNSGASYVDSINWAQIIYILGMILLLLFFIIMYHKEYRQIQAAIPIDKARKQRLKELVLLLPKRATILISDQVSTPLVFGIIHPRIILPKFLEDEVNLEFALTHEIIHIRRMDNLWKFIMIATLLVHWFNPLVWVMYLYFNRDIEMACDEKTIHLLGENQKKNYAYILINLAEKHYNCSLFSNGFGNKAVKERVVAIMKFRKNNIWRISSSFLLLALTITALGACSVEDKKVSEGYAKSSVCMKEFYADERIETKSRNGKIKLMNYSASLIVSSQSEKDTAPLKEVFEDKYGGIEGITTKYVYTDNEGKDNGTYTIYVSADFHKMDEKGSEYFLKDLTQSEDVNAGNYKDMLEKSGFSCE